VESDSYLLIVSTEFDLLVKTAETCLRRQGFSFIQNQGKGLVEFEIDRPAYFRVVVHRRNDAEVGNFLMPSIKSARGTFLDIWFSADRDETDNREARLCARQFLRLLVSSLPVPPWEGLKFREGGKARKKWNDLIGDGS
jgi:hypothetical protein